MALLDKNGKIYTLNRPNPIMASMTLWKNDKVILHNKVGRFVVLPDPTSPPMLADFALDTHTIEKTKELLNKPAETVIVKELDPEPEAGSVEEDKIQVWCLPASYKEYQDNLYGEKYRKIKYGNKFLLEAIALDQDDITFTMWTNTKAVTEGSILFPRTHDKRWWRVQRIKEQNDGHVCYAIISEYQPKFSD